MNATVKLNSIIKALENIDSASLHGLCDDLVYAGALVPDLKHKSIHPAGWNPSKHHTIPSPADSIVELEDGLCVFEYSREEDWSGKLKKDVDSIKRWVKSESCNLVRFVFVTTRNVGNKTIGESNGKKLTPEQFIEKELSHFNLRASVFGQKDLLIPLQNSEYFYIRREWLNILDDYFKSLKSFESYHMKQAQDRYISLKKYVESPIRQASINTFEDFALSSVVRVALIHSQGGLGKTRFALEVLKRVRERAENIDILFNQRKSHVNVDEVISEISDGQTSLIVLDDAHDIDNLTDFAKILSEKSHTKLILITRSTAKGLVKQEIGYPVEEIELARLDRESSIELLKINLREPPRDEYLRNAANICEGNPLLIGFSAHLINTRGVQSLGDFKGNNLVKDYLESILAELKRTNQVVLYHCELYLALLYLLKPFSINNDENRSLIRSIVNIDEVQEGFLLRHLEECAILERHGDTLWIYPDLLGEYLVTSVFFCNIPILDFDEIFSKVNQVATY